MAIDSDDIGGVVRSPRPEAGVWVIAETTDLPTKYAKMVVTDDQGRYVIPDLPAANYSVWVRGYGLVDSPKVRAKPGEQLNLTAIPAPDERAAAHYYPAIYWYTMMKMPPAKDFGGTSDIPKNITQDIWRQRMNNVDCIGCHQLGQEATRTIPAQLGQFKSGAEAWMRRIASGQTGEFMMNRIAVQLGGVPVKYFGDWTDRIAKGELPKHKPPRPQGVERNVVVTSWEWGTEKHYLHDLISSDRRFPTVNAYGPLYGSPEYATDDMPILDPKTHTVTFFKMPVADPNAPESFGPPFHGSAAMKPMQPSPYWGDEKIWSQRANNHNGMFDKKGRVWFAAAVRGIENPAFCRKGSDHPSAKVFPLDRSGRQVSMLDPKTMKYSFVDTCFGTHHPQFGYDADDTLWLSGTGPVAGWVNTKALDETGDAAKAQGWHAVRARHQRQRQGRRMDRAGPARARGQGHADRGLGSLRRDAASHRRLGLVHLQRIRRRPRLPALRPQDQPLRVLRHSEGRHRGARRRHRQERRAVGVGLERQPDQLRPA